MKTFNEIGGNYWLKPNQSEILEAKESKICFVDNNESVFYASSGRGAISFILYSFLSGLQEQSCLERVMPYRKHNYFFANPISVGTKQNNFSRKKALLPIFTCDSVIKPFIDNGFEVFFYEIETDLTVNIDNLKELISCQKPDVVFFQSYFGFDTLANIRPLFKWIKDNNINIIEDITHSWLSDFNKKGADYYLASLRKWLEIPDGGVAIYMNNQFKTDEKMFNENSEVLNLFCTASKLKHEYSNTLQAELKTEFRKHFYKIEDILDKEIQIYKMSKLSKSIFNTTNFAENKNKRRANFKFLLNHFKDSEVIEPIFKNLPDNIIPLYFPVFVKGERSKLQSHLAHNEVYAPIHWPVPNCSTDTLNNKSAILYNQILSIPCDQRYSTDDMKRIIDLINNLLS